MNVKFFSAATNVLLEVECNPKRQASFEAKYKQIVGKAPTGKHYQKQSGKWGLECRVYFDAPPTVVSKLKKAGLHVESRVNGYRANKTHHRVNRQSFFWSLVSDGYELGPNP